MDREEFILAQIAKMYYVDGLKQNEIAKRLDYTPMTISRMLKKAEQKKIVTIHIKMPWDQDMQLGRDICDRFGIRECVVLNSSMGQDDRLLIASYFADYFSAYVKDHMIIASSWGKTIASFATLLPFLSVRGCTVVQMNGAIWAPNPNLMPTQIQQNLCQKLNAQSCPMNAPLYVDSPATKQNLLKDPMNRMVQELTRKADMAIIGASAFRKEATTIESNVLVADATEELKRYGAVGDFGGQFLDADGELIQWSKSNLFMGVPLDEIALARNVICLAGGAEKASILKAAAKKRYYTTLITTKDTAQAMLQ